MVEARRLLVELGFDQELQNDRSALVLLALANLDPTLPWAQAAAPLLRTTDIMAWITDHYGVHYQPNTRETIRRFTLHQFLQAGLIAYNPDDPSRPVNSPKSCYQLRGEALEVLRQYVPMGNYVIGVGNYVIVSPSTLGNYKIADRMNSPCP